MENKPTKAFEKTLNRHGYGFHYAVLKHAFDLVKKGKSHWLFEVSEYPTQVDQNGTRIDFILKRSTNIPRNFTRKLPFYLLAECKRVNPALSNWCFISAPYTDRNPDNKLFLERARLDERNKMHANSWIIHTSEDIFHLGLEVKANKKGDPVGSTRGQIENASSQILRGLNGMVNYLGQNLKLFGNQKSLFLLPAIFTTANLWVTNKNLDEADLKSGKIDIDDCQKVDWLLYQYNTSPGIKHSYSPEENESNLSNILRNEYVRTIPIVNPDGIESFLSWSGQLEFEDFE